MVKETEIEAKAENFRDGERQSEAERQSKTERRQRDRHGEVEIVEIICLCFFCTHAMLMLMVKKQNGEELNREIEK